MKTRTVCKTHVLAACFLTALLVGTLGSVKAQGAWPPTPASGNDPYNAGTFTSNGRTYTISYIKASGGADGSGIGTCTATNSVQIADIDYVEFLNSSRSTAQFSYSSNGSTLVNVDSSGSGNISSDVGDKSHLRRFIDIKTDGGVSNGPLGSQTQSCYAQPSGQTNGGLYFYYKIVASNPYSNNFGVTIDMAQGGFTYAKSYTPGGTSTLQSFASSTPSDSSAIINGGTKQIVTQYTGSSPYQMTRGTDVNVQVTLTNGVGYFALNAVATTSSVNYSGKASDVSIEGNAETRLEVVPISVTGP